MRLTFQLKPDSSAVFSFCKLFECSPNIPLRFITALHRKSGLLLLGKSYGKKN